jgi:hypothetical protein
MPKDRRFHPILTLMVLLAAMFSAFAFEPRTWQCGHTFYGHAIYRGTISNQVVLLEVPGRTEWVRAPIHSLSEEDRRWVHANARIHLPERSGWDLPEWLERGLFLGFLISLLLHVLILAPLLPPTEPEPIFNLVLRAKKRPGRCSPAILTAALSVVCVFITAHWAHAKTPELDEKGALMALAIPFGFQFLVIWLSTRLNFSRAFLLNPALIAVTAASIWTASQILDPSRHSTGVRHTATHLSSPTGTEPVEPKDAPIARRFSSTGRRSVTFRRVR